MKEGMVSLFGKDYVLRRWFLIEESSMTFIY